MNTNLQASLPFHFFWSSNQPISIQRPYLTVEGEGISNTTIWVSEIVYFDFERILERHSE